MKTITEKLRNNATVLRALPLQARAMGISATAAHGFIKAAVVSEEAADTIERLEAENARLRAAMGEVQRHCREAADAASGVGMAGALDAIEAIATALAGGEAQEMAND